MKKAPVLIRSGSKVPASMKMPPATIMIWRPFVSISAPANILDAAAASEKLKAPMPASDVVCPMALR